MYKTVHLYAKIVAFLCGLLYKYKPFVQPSKEKPRKMYKTPIKQALLGLFFMLQRDLPKAYLHLPTVSFIATKNNLKNAIFKPPFETFPSLLGQVKPPSRETLYIFSLNFLFKARKSA